MRRSLTTRPNGSTRSRDPCETPTTTAYGTPPELRPDRSTAGHDDRHLAAGRNPITVGDHGDGIGKRRGRQLVAALGAHRRDVAAPVVFEAGCDPYQMDLVVRAAFETL